MGDLEATTSLEPHTITFPPSSDSTDPPDEPPDLPQPIKPSDNTDFCTPEQQHSNEKNSKQCDPNVVALSSDEELTDTEIVPTSDTLSLETTKISEAINEQLDETSNYSLNQTETEPVDSNPENCTEPQPNPDESLNLGKSGEVDLNPAESMGVDVNLCVEEPLASETEQSLCSVPLTPVHSFPRIRETSPEAKTVEDKRAENQLLSSEDQVSSINCVEELSPLPPVTIGLNSPAPQEPASKVAETNENVIIKMDEAINCDTQQDSEELDDKQVKVDENVTKDTAENVVTNASQPPVIVEQESASQSGDNEAQEADVTASSSSSPLNIEQKPETFSTMHQPAAEIQSQNISVDLKAPIFEEEKIDLPSKPIEATEDRILNEDMVLEPSIGSTFSSGTGTSRQNGSLAPNEDSNCSTDSENNLVIDQEATYPQVSTELPKDLIKTPNLNGFDFNNLKRRISWTIEEGITQSGNTNKKRRVSRPRSKKNNGDNSQLIPGLKRVPQKTVPALPLPPQETKILEYLLENKRNKLIDQHANLKGATTKVDPVAMANISRVPPISINTKPGAVLPHLHPPPATLQLPSTSIAAPTNAPSKKKLFTCSSCHKIFEKWPLFVHMRTVHKMFTCLHCIVIFSTLDRLVKHLEKKHGVSKKFYNDKDDILNSYKNMYDAELYLMCFECEHVFHESEEFTFHKCENYFEPCTVCGLRKKCNHEGKL